MSTLASASTMLAGAATWLLAGTGATRRRLLALRAAGDTGAASPAAVRARLGKLSGSWRRGREERCRSACTEMCFTLSAELDAGRTAVEALDRAVATAGPELAPNLVAVRGAVRTGGDIAGELRAAAAAPGSDGLRRLAACWQVGAGSGAGLARAVECLAETLRAEERHRREVDAQLAGPRATTRLLAGLPLVGVLMSAGLGLRPLDFLLGSTGGAACLVGGVALDVLGVLWTRRLARRAASSP